MEPKFSENLKPLQPFLKSHLVSTLINKQLFLGSRKLHNHLIVFTIYAWIISRAYIFGVLDQIRSGQSFKAYNDRAFGNTLITSLVIANLRSSLKKLLNSVSSLQII